MYMSFNSIRERIAGRNCYSLLPILIVFYLQQALYDKKSVAIIEKLKMSINVNEQTHLATLRLPDG